jgi:hypothetical protein
MKSMMILVLSSLLLFANLPSAAVHSFPSWEGVRFHYRAQKLGTTIIRASLSIERSNLHYVLKAAVDTTGLIRPFFRMHNRFSSFVKKDGLEPYRYVKEIDQKGIFSQKKLYTDTLIFDNDNCMVTVERTDPPAVEEISLPPHTYDPLAIFLKCFLEAEVEEGNQIEMTIYDGNKLREVTFAATYMAIPTPLYGEVQAVCLESEVPFSSLGDKEGAIKIWYTDDERRFPVNITLELPGVGDVEFELEKVEVW